MAQGVINITGSRVWELDIPPGDYSSWAVMESTTDFKGFQVMGSIEIAF